MAEHAGRVVSTGPGPGTSHQNIASQSRTVRRCAGHPAGSLQAPAHHQHKVFRRPRAGPGSHIARVPQVPACSLFPRPRCNSRAPDPRSSVTSHPLPCRASVLLLLVPVSAAFAPASVLRAVRPIQALPGRHVGNARLRAEATRAGDCSPRQGGAQRPRCLPSWWQRQPRGRVPRSHPHASPPNALVSRLLPAPESAGTRGLGSRASEAGAHAQLNMPSGACTHAERARSLAHTHAQARRRTSLFCAQMLPGSSLNPSSLALSRACALYSIGVAACAAFFLCLGPCRDTLGHLVYTARGADDACGPYAPSRAPHC